MGLFGVLTSSLSTIMVIGVALADVSHEVQDVSRQIHGTNNPNTGNLGEQRIFVNEIFPQPFSPLPESATILNSDHLPDKTSYLPEVGNGHIATVVQSDTIYMNGLYNGANITSHRARIPSTSGYSINSTTPAGLKRQYSLDLGRGIFTESYKGDNVTITIRTYAHRVLTNVLVTELELSRTDIQTDVDVTVNLNSGGPSIDVDFQMDTSGVLHGLTREAEFPEMAPRTHFYVKSSKSLQGKISMAAGKKAQTFLAVTVVDVDISTVEKQYYQASIMFVDGKLLSSHVTEWNRVWQTGRIDVEGDRNIARLNYACLYYLFSSLPFNGNSKSWPFVGLSPGGLAHGMQGKDYYGHVFWDQATWMFPGIALLHPDLGKLMVETRTKTLDAAKIWATRTGFEGARFPWESCFTGLETCPAQDVADLEIHIQGDVAMMTRQYWQLTGDRKLMVNQSGAEIVWETARYWASRVTYKKEDDSYRILDVMPPDEYHYHINDSTYTNNIAAINLKFANQLAKEFGKPENQTWAEIANKMYLPYDAELDYHPEFDCYKPPERTKQADVVLLNFPLMVEMNATTKVNDLLIYEKTTPVGPAPAMTWGMFLLGWLEQNNEIKAAELFDRSILNAQQPFLVWTENSQGNGATNFLTGMGGHLQTVLFAYGGCRIYDDRLSFNPKLITRTTKVQFTGINYRGASFDLGYTNTELALTLTSIEKGYPGLDIKFGDEGKWQKMLIGNIYLKQRQSFELRVEQ